MDIKNIIINNLIKYDFVVSAFIFGSFGTDDFMDDSDIDIAVLLKDKIDYMKLLQIEEELEDKLNIKVDLNSLEDLPESIQLQIMIRNELLYVKDEDCYDKYLDKLNYWYKTEYPFWVKLMTERASL